MLVNYIVKSGINFVLSDKLAIYLQKKTKIKTMTTTTDALNIYQNLSVQMFYISPFENCAITSGTLASNPQISSMPSSAGSAMEN